MIRKTYAVWCDEKGCQFRTLPWRTRVGAKQEAMSKGWLIYRDLRKKERHRCPAHHGNKSAGS